MTQLKADASGTQLLPVSIAENRLIRIPGLSPEECPINSEAWNPVPCLFCFSTTNPSG